jgi:hypothetical protein
MNPPAQAQWKIALSGVKDLRFDPYIDWAEATQYRDLASVAKGRLPIAIELRAEGLTAQQLAQRIEGNRWHDWIWMAAFYLDASDALASTRFCTAHVTREFFTRISTDLAGEIERFTLAMPFHDRNDSEKNGLRADNAPLQKAQYREDLGNVIVGVCEEGITPTHRRFFDDASGMSTRFQSFWNQDDRDNTASGLGYGSECMKSTIDSTLQNKHRAKGNAEEGVYRLADHADVTRLHHDTHYEPHETPLPLIGVRFQTHGRSKRDAGLWLDVQALEAVRYIIHRAQEVGGASCHALINLSYVTIAGPRDGSSLIESALDELMDTGTCSIVIPPDNSNLSRCHGVVTIAREAVLRWRLPHACATPSFVEIWFAANAPTPDIDVQIVTPDGDRSDWIESGDTAAYAIDDDTLCTVVHRGRGARGDGHMILVALAPSVARDETRRAARAGNWYIRLRNNSNAKVSAVYYSARQANVCRVSQPRA